VIRTDLIRPVPELLAEHAARRPEQIAFSDEYRQVSYRELARNTARLAGALADLGLGPGDRALLYLDNSVATVEAYLAVPRAGGIAVCANPASAPAEVAHILHDSGATVVLTDAAHLDTVRTLVSALPRPPAVITVGSPGHDAPHDHTEHDHTEHDHTEHDHTEHDYATLLASPETSAPRDCLALDDVAWMLYTSGTTGRPKGAMLTHGASVRAYTAWSDVVAVGSEPTPAGASGAHDTQKKTFDVKACGKVACGLLGWNEHLTGTFHYDGTRAWLTHNDMNSFGCSSESGGVTVHEENLNQCGLTGVGDIVTVNRHVGADRGRMRCDPLRCGHLLDENLGPEPSFTQLRQGLGELRGWRVDLLAGTHASQPTTDYSPTPVPTRRRQGAGMGSSVLCPRCNQLNHLPLPTLLLSPPWRSRPS